MTASHSLPRHLCRLLLSGLLAACSAAALAQTPPPTGMRAPDAMRDSADSPMSEGPHMGQMDPVKMQAMRVKRQAEMKAKLKITPSQEPAWTAFTSAIQPAAGGMGWGQSPEQRSEMAKLTTPERIDKMRTLRSQRMTEMNVMADKRDDATKTFYGVLSADQKAMFDTESAKGGHRGMHRADRMHKG